MGWGVWGVVLSLGEVCIDRGGELRGVVLSLGEVCIDRGGEPRGVLGGVLSLGWGWIGGEEGGYGGGACGREGVR